MPMTRFLVALLALLLAMPGLAPGASAAQGRKFALVIGIGPGYQAAAFRTLRHAEEDARRMAERLRQLGFQVVAEVTGEQATKQGIARGIDALGQAADNPFDTVLVYYSGHGALVRGGGRTMPSLVPQDADPEQRSSFVTDAELGTWLSNGLATRNVILVLDSCYSAGIAGGTDKRLADPQQASLAQVEARKQALQQARFLGALFDPYVILASSQAQETSKETAKGGLFTYYLLQGLGDAASGSCPACESGQNEVTPASWLRYAAAGVQAQVDQAPQLRGDATQAEQLALLVPWAKPQPGMARPRRSAAPAPSVTPTEAPVAAPSAAPQRGRLTITTTPAGAKITVNGRSFTSPMHNVEVPPGIYTATITRSGYEPLQEEIEIDEDRPARYAFRLIQQSRQPAPTYTQPSYTPTAAGDAWKRKRQLEQKKATLHQQWEQINAQISGLWQKKQQLEQQKYQATSWQQKQQVEQQMQQLIQYKYQLEAQKRQVEQSKMKLQYEINQIR